MVNLYRDFVNCPLMQYLKAENVLYYSKVLEVRKSVEDWLSYIPVTFPNYTRHTIRHSDEIIFQLSKILFENEDPTKPMVKLSSIETYMLIVAAFLHDSGMVASEAEKGKILESEEWKIFISSGNPGSDRWEKILDFRKGQKPENKDRRKFLADVQLRFLIAEFIRSKHHTRVANIIEQHEYALGKFSFGNQILKETICNICISHGLNRAELLDSEKYPERRDIMNEASNVRFISLLLRIGDLLDMASDRACPLLLNIACSIPSDSFAHWTKYQRITHRLTAPDRIEVYASCNNQEEHRFLLDWCKWLVDEIKEAGTMMVRALRHSSWRPPIINLDGNNATIRIEPAEDAKYIPSIWRFNLNETIIFERLITDVYNDPLTFVRELVQNALDANRCQLYMDLEENGVDPPDFPTLVDEKLRNKYPIKISLSEKSIRNELSENDELYQIISVEDFGIGMDKKIIENYFLQVGNSYYNTSEFRRSFSFIPTSRFGLGFLSVFAISENVTVETFKPSSKSNDGALRLRLTGPRNYLLLEKGMRKKSGTKIEIVMRKFVESEELLKRIEFWCKKVEFPIVINILDKKKVIKSIEYKETTKKFISLNNKKIEYCFKQYPIESYGIEGAVYIPIILDRKNERWDKWDSTKKEYSIMYPTAQPLKLEPSILCLNGITISNENKSGYSHLVDIRKALPQLPLSRNLMFYREQEELVPEIQETINNALKSHLKKSRIANSKNGWEYKNSVAREYGSFDFWNSCPETIPVVHNNKSKLISFSELMKQSSINLKINSKQISNIKLIVKNPKLKKNNTTNNITYSIQFNDFHKLFSAFQRMFLRFRCCSSIERLTNTTIQVKWRTKSKSELDKGATNINVIDFENPDLFAVFFDYPINDIVYNLKNPLTKWLLEIKDECKLGNYGLTRRAFYTTLNIVNDGIKRADQISVELPINYDDWKKANVCLKNWSITPNLPKELQPPLKYFKPDSILRISPYMHIYKIKD